MNFKYCNRGRVLNVKKIIAVKNATYAVAKKFLKNFSSLPGIRNPDLCDTVAAL